ncbi:hypothetical protein BDAP_002106 [Binucleata daphniae]
MDGNRRYSKKNKITDICGKKRGFNKMIEIAKCCYNNKIESVSFFAFSISNFQRSKEEVANIMNLILNNKDSFTNTDFKPRINFYGRRDMLTEEVKEIFDNIENQTSQNSDIELNIFFAYSSKYEMAQKRLYYDKRIDLLVRTGDAKRLSDFMLKQISFGANIAFCSDFWPDFSILRFYLILHKTNYENINFKQNL